MTPIQREELVLSDVEMFAALVSRRAWGWKNIDPWQRQLLTCEDRNIIVNASRQSGKSSTIAIKVFHKAIITPDALILILAKQDQADEDMRKIKSLYKAYSDYLREKYDGKLDLSLVEDNKHTIELAGNRRIISLAATERTRGYSAPTLVWVDEVRDVPDEAYIALKPMLIVSQGQLMLSSTPGGTSGIFSAEWKNPAFTHFKVPWWDCPRIPKEDIERDRMWLGDAYVEQEYSCKFLDDVSALFTEQALTASIDETENVFSAQMEEIQKVVSPKGEVELV